MFHFSMKTKNNSFQEQKNPMQLEQFTRCYSSSSNCSVSATVEHCEQLLIGKYKYVNVGNQVSVKISRSVPLLATILFKAFVVIRQLRRHAFTGIFFGIVRLCELFFEMSPKFLVFGFLIFCNQI